MMEMDVQLATQTAAERKATRVLFVTTALGAATGATILIMSSLVAADHQSIAGSVIGTSVAGGIMLLTSLFGLWGAKRERSGQSGRTQLLVYFYSCLFTLALILFFSIGALEFRDTFEHYVRTHWDSVQEDFPELSGMNRTEAIDRAEELVGRNFTVIGAVGLASMACLTSGLWASATILTWPVVVRDVLKVVNGFFMLTGTALLSFSVFVARHHEVSPGLGWLPIAMAAASGVLVLVGVLGCYAASRKDEHTGRIIRVYIVLLSLLLAVLAAMAIACFIFAGQVRSRYEAMSEKEFQRSVNEAGLAGNVTRAEFEGILESNFRFMGLGGLLVVLFAIIGTVAACRYNSSMRFYQYGSV